MVRPMGVAIIGYFYIFGAMVMLYTSIFYHSDADTIGVAARFGLLQEVERPTRMIVAIVSFIIAFGYMQMKRWGYGLMLAYSVIFAGISLSLTLTYNQQPYIGNLVWSTIVIIYTLLVYRSFFPAKATGSHKKV
ncbi:hypothetical protein [Ammoniphilus sp. CFH 90114]|uniref:hypothetical protein n=1 Tax=Ammoniphilus sp. CFH 90114 TaxID=2493665 RepID=UPI00100DA4FF|nr:hypothetical protein [Ammoniphilus sp. CFH 90114]RXT03629.1 hypothetical protein EIZ39_23675 [Ammoniphilus sp. CFH 90114]